MGNLELLERAFALADSGEVKNIHEIREALAQGGISTLGLSQFLGRALKKQLLEKIVVARQRCEQPRSLGDTPSVPNRC